MQEILPLCDLILSRDMFIHFSFIDILQTVENFKKSGNKYLLTNNYPDIKDNLDIKTGSWRPINLLIKPFNFSEPIEVFNEDFSEKYGIRQMALFIINN